MSKRHPATLHIEWTPGRVRAYDTATRGASEAATIAELGSILYGHKETLVGVGRSLAFLRTMRLPRGAPEDLRRILTGRMAQLFPLPPDQLAFDFIQTANRNEEGFLTVVAAIRADDLMQLRGELQRSGLKATRILPIALGSAAVARRAGLTDALVIAGDEAGISLDVVKDGAILFSRSVAPGSDAEIEARRTLAAADVGTLPLLAADFSGVPGAQTVSGGALELLESAPDFEFARNEDRLQAEKQRISMKTRFAFLMILAAILLAALIWVERQEAQAKVARSVGVWAKELSKRRSIRNTEIKNAQEATVAQAALTRAFEPAQPLSDIAGVIGDALPQSAWITGLTIERGKPTQIRGTAVQPNDVARFVAALSKSPRFREVRLIFANSAKVDEVPVVQFSINTVAIGNLPLPAPEKATKKAAPTNKPSATAQPARGVTP